MPIDPIVLEKVQAIVADVTGMDPVKVTRDALLGRDLGFESLELLEIGFRCERAFNVRVKFEDLDKQELTVGHDGTLSADSRSRLRARFPVLNVARWKSRRFNYPWELGAQMTVEDIVEIVASEIQRAGK